MEPAPEDPVVPGDRAREIASATIPANRRQFLTAASAVVATLAWSAHRQAPLKLFDLFARLQLSGLDGFVIAEAFRPGSLIGNVRLSATSWNFSKHFENPAEYRAPAAMAECNTLLYTAADGWILESLDGRIDVDPRIVAHIHGLMALGQAGGSHMDGRSNFTYVRSPIDRGLLAVNWFLNHTDEWVIGAANAPHPHMDWQSGSRFFTIQSMAA